MTALMLLHLFTAFYACHTVLRVMRYVVYDHQGRTVIKALPRLFVNRVLCISISFLNTSGILTYILHNVNAKEI